MTDPVTALGSSPGLGMLHDLETYADADPRDLGGSDISQLRNLFESTDGVGLFLFNRTIMGYKDLTTTLHLPICKVVSRWGQSHMADGSIITHPPGEDEEALVKESWRRLIVMIPREHFKTSVCTRGNALWTVACDPTHDATIAIFNEKEENAKSWVGAIAEVVEGSLLFQLLWPEMIPQGISFADREKGKAVPRRWKWGDSGIKFVRNSMGVPELSIEPKGILGAAAGKHWTHMILDDIIGKAASDSDAVMGEAISWVDTHRSMERPAENGCELIACTPWGYADVYSHMTKKWGDYRIYRRSLLENENGEPDVVDGKAIMPSKISTRKAKWMLDRDDYHFWGQYMCIPKSGRYTDFDEKWMRYGHVIDHGGKDPMFRIDDEHYNRNIVHIDCDDMAEAPQFVPLSSMDKTVILDPAPTKDAEMRRNPGAKNGIVVVGQDPWGRKFQLDECAIRVDPLDVLRKLVAMCIEWGIRRIAIEDVNFSYVYRPFMSHIMETEYSELNIDFVGAYTEGVDKDTRIKNQMPILRGGFMYFNQPCTRYTIQEFLEYPNGATVDLIDALAYTDQCTSRPDTPGEAWMTAYANRESEDRGLTGYGFH